MNSGEKASKTECERVFKVMIVAPTCFYYQSALFEELAAHPRIDLKVYFCSEEALYSADVAKTFGSDGVWGAQDEALSGFDHGFLRNYAPWPSYLRWPHGLMNFGIWNRIRKERPDAVILMAWVNITWWIAILASLVYQIPFLYMTDANIEDEKRKSRWKTWAKNILLSQGILREASGFLCAGTANRSLYRYYGVAEEKLFPFVYSWGYKSLREADPRLTSQRQQIRSELGIPHDSRVVLYCGRFSPEKNLFQLLEAFKRIDSPKKLLIFVGDGELRGSLQKAVHDGGLDSVRFFGFQSREDIPKFYAVSDLLVLPSKRETWGIVVNEALCFGLPVVVSDQVGSGIDLISEGQNGHIFADGDVAALSSNMQHIIDLPEEAITAMSAHSRAMIDQWLNRDLGESMAWHLDAIYSRRAGTRET